jgi:hypothetical protein
MFGTRTFEFSWDAKDVYLRKNGSNVINRMALTNACKLISGRDSSTHNYSLVLGANAAINEAISAVLEFEEGGVRMAVTMEQHYQLLYRPTKLRLAYIT